MRSALDRLYAASLWLGAFFLVLLLAMVLLGILGRELGFHVRGTDAYAGYFMAASGFLALPATLKRGEHIRVALVVDRLPAPWRRRAQLFALAVGALLALLFAWFSVRMAWQSWQFNDISTANDATPLWIPQIAMAVGAVVLLIAFIDEFLITLRGGTAGSLSGQAREGSSV
ncbi:MAG: TRAP transporter small permease [Casimicrobiaceae bacterium]